MVTQRKPTVLTPKVPRATKPKPVKAESPEWASRPGQPVWRVRFTADANPQTASTYFHDRDDAEQAQVAKPGTVLETIGASGLWGRLARDVPTVQDLAADGMAREVMVGNATRWEISPLGQEVITDAMVGRDE